MPAFRIKSVIEGRDPKVLDALFGFYKRPVGIVVDATCNRRRMWKGLNTDGVVFCDIDPEMNPDRVCDFRKMPFADGEASVIVFDPPHLPEAAASRKSDQAFAKRFGLGRSVKEENISSIFLPFLKEAHRVLREEGLIFAKLIDFVHNHRYQWTLVDWINAVRSVPGLTPTDLIIKRDPSHGSLASGRWVNSHHSRRSHCWWCVVRKGACVSKVREGPRKRTGRFLHSGE